ncbi:uncharacterized protein LOC113555755 [Rhopalosiphum maidis]|uniref:uncharacterized protein LOC113555755 n=1 Tax=Rhopalosiphum maidis TaxID=43146 RepID=UPI000EFF2B74|nr:uncharacterized protein LOC113555755 [Rhopalosiphum maidis]
MNSPQYQKCYTEPACDKNTSINTQEETVKDHVKNVDCGNQKPATKNGQFYKCCTLSPVVPTPLINIDCCEKARPCKGNFCSSVNADCDDFELTPYGKEFVLRTGRLIQNCLCVKLNGLQDSCKHPGCCTKIGCMDIPFPNCPPARLWKNEYICRNKKKPQLCSDE